MSLKGKRIAILAEEDFEDSELIEPLKAMKDVEASVTIVGSGTKSTYHGKRGKATVHVDATANEVSDEDMIKILREEYERTQISRR